MNITIKWLKEKNACSDQVELFKKTFGEKATLNLPNLKKAATSGLNIDWFAEHFLSAPALKAYDEARATAFWNALKGLEK